jgi:hypothetical protein
MCGQGLSWLGTERPDDVGALVGHKVRDPFDELAGVHAPMLGHARREVESIARHAHEPRPTGKRYPRQASWAAQCE